MSAKRGIIIFLVLLPTLFAENVTIVARDVQIPVPLLAGSVFKKQLIIDRQALTKTNVFVKTGGTMTDLMFCVRNAT